MKKPAEKNFQTPARVVSETGRFIPEQQAYLHIVHTAEVLRGATAELFAAHGLSGKQYNALRAIRRAGAPGAAISRIAQEMVESGADVSRLVDRLERDGWVERNRDRADRRTVRVGLTAKGEQVLSSLDEPLVALHVKQLGHMDSVKLLLLIQLLKEVRQDASSD